MTPWKADLRIPWSRLRRPPEPKRNDTGGPWFFLQGYVGFRVWLKGFGVQWLAFTEESDDGPSPLHEPGFRILPELKSFWVAALRVNFKRSCQEPLKDLKILLLIIPVDLPYVCMYVCLHTRMPACMHACIHVCMHACMHACVHAYMYACTHAWL